MSQRFYGDGIHVNPHEREKGFNGCCDNEYQAPHVEECMPVVECPSQKYEAIIPVSEAECIAPSTNIPHVATQTLAEARSFPNHFVFVEDTQTYVHIDAYGNSAILSNPFIFIDNFDPIAKEGIFKNCMVFDFAKGKQYIYNPSGSYAVGNITPKMSSIMLGDI